MRTQPYNVLFICQHNAARSIFAEALLAHWGQGRFRTYSAGSDPHESVHPQVLETLEHNRLPTENVYSKHWSEFEGESAPAMDFVITLCDASQESCPTWPGHPVTAHWGVEDPLAGDMSDHERSQTLHRVYRELANRIKLFVELPFDSLENLKLKARVEALGEDQ